MNYAMFPIWRVLDDAREYRDSLKAEEVLRLRSAVHGISGAVTFYVQGGVNLQQQKAIMGQATVELELICQRCLEPYQQSFVVPLHWVPARSEEAVLKVGNDDVALLATDETVNLVELIEDEILLAIPLVPQHLSNQPCEGRIYLEQQILMQEERTNPFAELSKLLKNSQEGN